MLSSQDAIVVRKAKATDIPQIVKLVDSVYRGENSRQGWTTEADLLDGQRTDAAMVTELMQVSDFLIALHGEKLMASVQLEKKMGYAYIGMLSVNVEAQNLKLGRRMLVECEQYTKREWGFNETRITVIERRHELVQWYERRGYIRTGRVEEFHDDPRFGIPKVDNLHLIEMAKPIQDEIL